MNPHPVSKDQSQSLVRGSDEAHMKIHVTFWVAPARPKVLHPDCRIVMSSRRHVVTGVAGPALEAHRGERTVEPLSSNVEIGDADLHIEDVFGVHRGNSSAPDVLDATRVRSEGITELGNKH